jgi:tetratricopeptide (TPR) repeat protein
MAFAASGVLLGLLASALAAQQPTGVPPDSGNRPVQSPGNAQWAANAAEARARAAEQHKLVYVELDSQGCGNCKRMDALLYPAFDFEALLVPMVPLKLALESSEGTQMAQHYGISQAPAVLITTPEGRLVFRVEGFRDAPDFYGHARKDLDAYRQFARRIDAQDISKLPAAEAFATGRELYSRFDPAAARPRLRRATVAPDASPALKASAFEGLAAVELDLGEPEQARRSIERTIALTKNGDQRERAELFRAQIPLSQNKPEEALVLYKKFRKDHPSSRYLDKVKSFIERLERPAPKS